MQLVKYPILKHSVDENTQFIYGHVVQRHGGKKQWNSVKELHERERHLFINELCRGQIGRQGLGFIKGQKRFNKMTEREHRSSVSSLTKDVSEEQLLVSLYGMAKQGRLLGWETAMQMDTRCNILLYSWSPEMLKFYLNAIQDTLPLPANLKKWNKHLLGQCSLCGYNCCTMLRLCCTPSIAASSP